MKEGQAPPAPAGEAEVRAMRASRRPRECDERPGCWVKVGRASCNVSGSATPRCTACDGYILSDNLTQQDNALRRIRA